MAKRRKRTSMSRNGLRVKWLKANQTYSEDWNLLKQDGAKVVR